MMVTPIISTMTINDSYQERQLTMGHNSDGVRTVTARGQQRCKDGNVARTAISDGYGQWLSATTIDNCIPQWLSATAQGQGGSSGEMVHGTRIETAQGCRWRMAHGR